MGMRVNTGSGIDPKLVEQLAELERLPIKNLEARKAKVIDEQKEFRDLVSTVNELGASLNGLKNRQDFFKLKVDSSHPDIIDGVVDANAPIGSYEVELRSLARTQKLLAETYPDKDDTPVGFGYMTIELDNGDVHEVEIDSDASTLQDVVKQINGLNIGVKAMVINTKEQLEDPNADGGYRLLVLSEKTGKESRIYIDPDTTYLDFKEQVTGRNLEMVFEDVTVYDDDNTIEDLIPGMVLNAKRAEPGTKVNITVSYDVEQSFESIKKFVESYNKLNDFINKQYTLETDAEGRPRAGVLASDSTLRSVRSAMVSALQTSMSGGRFRSIADIGINSEPRSGQLQVDESKLKQALNQDYAAVAALFTQSEQGQGVAASLSEAVRRVQNPAGGPLKSKERQITRALENFQSNIDRQERIAEQRTNNLKRKFAAMESMVAGLNRQGEIMQARLGGGGGGG